MSPIKIGLRRLVDKHLDSKKHQVTKQDLIALNQIAKNGILTTTSFKGTRVSRALAIEFLEKLEALKVIERIHPTQRRYRIKNPIKEKTQKKRELTFAQYLRINKKFTVAGFAHAIGRSNNYARQILKKKVEKGEIKATKIKGKLYFEKA